MCDINFDKEKIVRSFYEAGEPYAAGFFTYPERNRFFKFSYAQRTFWENTELPQYNSGKLYPQGIKYVQQHAVLPNYSFTFSADWNQLKEKNCIGVEFLQQETALLSAEYTPHTVGGFCFTHSIPNYGRIISEGLNSYEQRIKNLKEGDFRDGLLEVVTGIRTYQKRSLELLKKSNAYAPLVKALEKVPFSPAENLYEALVCWNFIFYIDGCDNPGRLDTELIPFYRGEDIEDILHEFFINVDQNDGWSSALGPDYNPLTLQCLKAVRNLRRPSIELRVSPEMPDEIWDTAAEALLTGCGQPAFYNEAAFQEALSERFPMIPKEDLNRFNGGGCTETMLAGISHVGSLDAGINLALIFSEFMRKELVNCTDFQEFYDGLFQIIQTETNKTLSIVNDYRQKRAEIRPHPVRTLLIDDCIDKAMDFNAGGARYYWSVVNIAGLVNIIDSLLAIRKLIYQDKAYDAHTFIQLLDAQDDEFLKRLRSCPCYGVDDDNADKLAAQFTTDVYHTLDQKTPFLGGAFLPSSIQFITYADAGVNVPATPDGRASGQPLVDSIGAIHGKDKEGPTAMLNSAAKLPQKMAAGTPVLNIRLQKKLIKQQLKAIILGYFEQNGMQVQVSCLSREDMLDALKHPEKHENLIVRIGGYAEYFNRLSPELKQTVIDRTEFGR